MRSQSTCEKLLSCSSGFAVYSSEERQLVWGLVMGFSIVCKKTASYGYTNFHRGYRGPSVKSYRKGHFQRSVACEWPSSSHFKATRSYWEAPGKEAQGSESEEVGGNRCKLTSSPCTRTHTQRQKVKTACRQTASSPLRSPILPLFIKLPEDYSLCATDQARFLHHMAKHKHWVNQSPSSLGLSFLTHEMDGQPGNSQTTQAKRPQTTCKAQWRLVREQQRLSHSCVERAMLWLVASEPVSCCLS